MCSALKLSTLMPSWSRAYLCPALPLTSALANLGCRLRLGPGKLAPVPGATRSGPYHHEACRRNCQGTRTAPLWVRDRARPYHAHFSMPLAALAVHMHRQYRAMQCQVAHTYVATTRRSGPLHPCMRPRACALAPLRTRARILQYAYPYHTCMHTICPLRDLAIFS
jgi:hypothetical protein